MNCDNVNELLAAYLDGEATSEERSRVERHLSACEKCKADLKLLGTTQTNLRQALKTSAGDAEPSPLAWNAVRQRIESPDSFWERLSKFLNGPGVRMAVPVAVLVVLAAGLIWKAGNFIQYSSIPPAPAATDTPPRSANTPAPAQQPPSPAPQSPTALPSLAPAPIAPAPTVTVTPSPQVPTTPTIIGEQQVIITPPQDPAGPAGPAGAETPPPSPPPTALPPITNNVTVPAPVVNVAPAQVTVQPPNVTTNPPQVPVQPPPPAPVNIQPPTVNVAAPPAPAVTVTVPRPSYSYPAYLEYLWVLPIGLAIALIVVLLLPRQKR